MHSLNEGKRGQLKQPRLLSGRGLSDWTDGREARIIYVTPGYQMVALDAKTGARVAGFGKNGIVDLKQDFDQAPSICRRRGRASCGPRIANDVVIIGAAFETGANPKSKTNIKGYVRGFDVRTGKRIWVFTRSRGRATSA